MARPTIAQRTTGYFQNLITLPNISIKIVRIYADNGDREQIIKNLCLMMDLAGMRYEHNPGTFFIKYLRPDLERPIDWSAYKRPSKEHRDGLKPRHKWGIKK